MSSTDSSDLSILRLQVAVLQQRVSWLEQAIKPSAADPQPVPLDASFARDRAEKKARMDAIEEYRYLDDLAFYRRSPEMLHRMLASTEKRHAFLREKGIEPEDSDIVRIARQLAKERTDASGADEISEPSPAPVVATPTEPSSSDEFAAEQQLEREYGEKKMLDLYRECPEELEADLAAERDRNAFFVARGGRPDDRIARIAKRLAEEQKAAKRRRRN